MPISSEGFGGCLAIGEAVVDLVEDTSGDRRVFRAQYGGAPLNVAVGVRRLGGDAELLSAVASDDFGKRIAAFLEHEHVGLRNIARPSDRTSLAIASVGQDGLEFTGYGFGEVEWDVRAEAHRAAISGCRVLYLGNEPLRSAAGRSLVARCLRADGPLTVMDPNFRPAVTGEKRAFTEFFRDALRFLDVVKVSEDDIRLLFGMRPYEFGAFALERGARIAVITRASRGAVLFQRGSEPIDLPGERVSVVDTTGAGDAFCASLITDLLSTSGTSMDWENALRRANHVAAMTCTSFGGAESITGSPAVQAPRDPDDPALKKGQDT